MRASKLLIMAALLVLLSAYCFSANTVALPTSIQPKLSGEPPNFEEQEIWTYNYSFTNLTSLSSVQTTMHANTTNIIFSEVKDYYNKSRDCYILWFSPVDPQSTLILLDILSRGFGITDLNASDIVGLGDTSILLLYLGVNTTQGEYNFSWVRIDWRVDHYSKDNKELNVLLTMSLNVTCSYSIFNFTLFLGKDFGNYTSVLNVSYYGFVDYYNGTMYNLYASGNLTYNFPDTYLFYPAFRVEGTENVVVPAGTFECWRIAVLNATDPSDTVGYYWYSPDAKIYAKIDMNTTDSFGNRCNIYAELTYSYSTGAPWSPGIEWELPMSLLLSYSAAYNSYRQQQGNTILLVGVAVLLIVAAVVGIIISIAVKQK
ncbi:MAG: hypothetical protein QXS27_06395 [Candidatus Jordarchaeaceae archaeon]